MTDRPLVLDRMRAQLVEGVARHRVRCTHRLIIGTAAALIALIAGTGAVIASTNDDSPRGVITNPGETTVAPTTSLGPTTTLAAPAVTGTATVGQFPYHVIVADGAVWVLAWYDNAIQRVDPTTLVVDTIVLDPRPQKTITNRMAYADGRVWVAGGQVLYAVDSDSLATTTYQIDGGVIAVGAGHSSVWAVQFAPARLVRLDSSTGAVQASIDLGGRRAMDIAVTDEAVWVLGQGGPEGGAADPSWLARVDADTNTITGTSEIPDFAVRVVADERGVVVGSTERPAGETYGTVMLIDPETGEIATSARTAGRPEGLALAGDRVWASACAGSFTGGVCAFDRTSLTPLAAVQTGAFSLAAGEGSIWGVRGVTTGLFQSIGALDRIDPGPYG